MNGMWGYKIKDQDYKDTRTLIHYLIGAAGRGANLLLNVGPQPDGSIPAAALARFKEMGEWLRANGETVYGTFSAGIDPQPWGAVTRKGGGGSFRIVRRAASQMARSRCRGPRVRRTIRLRWGHSL